MKLSKKLLIPGFLAAALGWYGWEKGFKDRYYFNKFMEFCPQFMAAKYNSSINPTPENIKRFSELHKKIFKYCHYDEDKLEKRGYVYVGVDNIFGKIENMREIKMGDLEIKVIEFREDENNKPIRRAEGFQKKNKIYLNLTQIEKGLDNEDANDYKMSVFLHELYHLLDPPKVISYKKGKTVIYSTPEKELGAMLFTILYTPNQQVSDIVLRHASVAETAYIKPESASVILKKLRKNGFSNEEIAKMTFDEIIEKAKEYGFEPKISEDHNVLASKRLFEEFKKLGINYKELCEMDYKKRSILAQLIYYNLGYSTQLPVDVSHILVAPLQK